MKGQVIAAIVSLTPMGLLLALREWRWPIPPSAFASIWWPFGFSNAFDSGEIKHARVVQLSSELQQIQELNKQLEDDKHEAQVLITALKERLKISDELLKSSKEECRRKLVKLEEDLAKFKFNSEAQIARLKQRFIKRRLIAHIAQLEKQIASLNIEKKVRQSNRLLALRRHIKQYHCSPRDQIEK